MLTTLYLYWGFLKIPVFCVALFWVIRKKYLSGENVFPILLIIMLSGIPAFFLAALGTFEAAAGLLFAWMRKKQGLPLLSRDSLWLYLFIISAEWMVFLVMLDGYVSTHGK